MDSGLYALTLTAIILQEWIKARGEGADEGGKGLISALRIEYRLWGATAVLMFAGIPMVNLDLNTLKFDDT